MIYCVEDDAGIRELVVYTLRNTGFEADGFEDGAALTAALKKCKPQLILLDIMLPGANGFELMDYITALEDALGMVAEKNMMPIQPGDVLDTSADTQPLYDLVGFKPQTSVKDGVKNFVDWYKDYYQI